MLAKLTLPIALSFLLSIGSVFADQTEYKNAVSDFEKLTIDRIQNIKEGSKPFLLGQGKQTKTVLLFHGLSDSPGSMAEMAQTYYSRGFNVASFLLRDHGLSLELRNEQRSSITLNKWRQDVDAAMKIAFKLSDTKKVAVAGYSLGGAMVIDTADRYPNRISSIVMVTPMFKMMYSAITPLTKYLKKLIYSTKKGIDEMPHFYPDIALNQTYHASVLTRHLKKKVTKKPEKHLVDIPKIMFLTTADTTIINKYVQKTAKKLKMKKENIVMFQNEDDNKIVLHRDLPMRYINSNGAENPHLDKMLIRIDEFLEKEEQD
jgi:alpha-beta hydrolase superfamily lysophospholipase